MALLGPYGTEDLAITACAGQLNMAAVDAKPCDCAKQAVQKNAQLPAKPCNCAKKALMKNKPIDRKSIMM